MPNSPLGRLERVELRTYWLDEARDFTPWLSTAGNLALLSDTLGMELEFTSSEAFVGPYRTDILAMDLASNTKVVIENQLEKTDHDHLGKGIVYAAGHDAKILIWIAKEFTEEHRRAIDFLNEKNAAPDLRLFALEVQLWRIGSSDPAPLFKVVASPNDFSSIIRVTDKQQLGETAALYQEFWTGFKQYCLQHNSSLHIQNRKAMTQHWFSIAIGRSHFELSLTASIQNSRLGCEIYISGPNAKKALKLLKQNKAEIEAAVGTLDWYEKSSGQDCRIMAKLPDFPVTDKSKWPTGFEWLRKTGETIHKTFYPYIKDLPPLDAIEEEAFAGSADDTHLDAIHYSNNQEG